MSPKYSLNTQDLQKIGKGALIAVSGALLTYLLGELPNIDFGSFTAVAVATFSILINGALKFIEESKTEGA